MACVTVDYIYATVLAVFVVTAVVATWWHSSLAKVLALRHPTIHALLGKPNPPRTAESDKHNAAMFRFILAREYESLNDEVVNKHAQILRVCVAISAVSVIAVAALAGTTSSPEALLTMQCWRGP